MAKPELLPIRQSDDFGTILSNEFKLIKPSWEALQRNLGTILLVYILPILLILALVFAINTSNLFHPGDKTLDPQTFLLVLLCMIGIAILVTLLSISSVMVQLVSARGKKISFQQVIENSWPFFWRVIGLSALTILVVLAGLVLLIIPGILAVFYLSFAIYYLIDKNCGIIDAMKGSYQLTKANWKIVLAYLVVTIAISLPQIVPVLGAMVSSGLSIAYFCLPAILYLRMSK